MHLRWRRRNVGEPDHELIWFVVSSVSIVVAAFWVLLALPSPKCVFRAITGWPCVTCGSTRSLIEILGGNIGAAVRWNPLAVAALCGLVIFDLYAVVVLVGRTPRLRIVDWTVIEKRVVRIAVVGLLALNWIYLLANHDRF